MHMKRDLIMSSDGETKCQKKMEERKSAFCSFAKRHFFRSIGFRLIPRSQSKEIVKFSKSQLLQNDRRFASWLPPSLKSFPECMMTSLHFSLIKTTFWKKGALCLPYHVLDGKNYFWLSDFFVLIKKGEIDIKSFNSVGPFSLQYPSKNH